MIHDIHRCCVCGMESKRLSNGKYYCGDCPDDSGMTPTQAKIEAGLNHITKAMDMIQALKLPPPVGLADHYILPKNEHRQIMSHLMHARSKLYIASSWTANKKDKDGE